eukprot:scaffold10803_cov51-Phaeocystis_antarctica.AAC.2
MVERECLGVERDVRGEDLPPLEVAEHGARMAVRSIDDDNAHVRSARSVRSARTGAGGGGGVCARSARSPRRGARQAFDELLDSECVVPRPQDEGVCRVDSQLGLEAGQVPAAAEDVELGAICREHGEEELRIVAGLEVLLVVHEDEHLGGERGLQVAKVVTDTPLRVVVPAARA